MNIAQFSNWFYCVSVASVYRRRLSQATKHIPTDSHMAPAPHVLDGTRPPPRTPSPCKRPGSQRRNGRICIICARHAPLPMPWPHKTKLSLSPSHACPPTRGYMTSRDIFALRQTKPAQRKRSPSVCHRQRPHTRNRPWQWYFSSILPIFDIPLLPNRQ